MSIVIQKNGLGRFRVYNKETKEALRYQYDVDWAWKPTKPGVRFFPFHSREDAINSYNKWKEQEEIKRIDPNVVISEEIID